jgi:hypothetical protein
MIENQKVAQTSVACPTPQPDILPHFHTQLMMTHNFRVSTDATDDDYTICLTADSTAPSPHCRWHHGVAHLAVKTAIPMMTIPTMMMMMMEMVMCSCR